MHRTLDRVAAVCSHHIEVRIFFLPLSLSRLHVRQTPTENLGTLGCDCTLPRLNLASTLVPASSLFGCPVSACQTCHHITTAAIAWKKRKESPAVPPARPPYGRKLFLACPVLAVPQHPAVVYVAAGVERAWKHGRRMVFHNSLRHHLLVVAPLERGRHEGNSPAT
ncbi:hypothetical protein CGRA01v4_01370 [Colletotrichum graminicola]|nr:hypothetical protein CGRA01v4_01370 [Colletotrichum graminicola]